LRWDAFECASEAAGLVASWGASQQIPEPRNAMATDDLRDATVRQIFHLSVAARRCGFM